MTAIVRKPSPHHSARTQAIDCVVVHADAGRTDAGTIAWLADPDSKVSYHYLIGRDGTVYRFVDDDRKAWHAGVSEFQGRRLCNEYSLGVAFANDQRGEPFTPAQLASGAVLVADLCRTYGIPQERVTTHAIVSPGRKHDPGPLFDWWKFMARVGALLAETT